MSRSWRGKKAGEDAERLLQEAFGVSEDQLLKDFILAQTEVKDSDIPPESEDGFERLMAKLEAEVGTSPESEKESSSENIVKLHEEARKPRRLKSIVKVSVAAAAIAVMVVAMGISAGAKREYRYVVREKETAPAFLERLAKREGAVLKCWAGTMTMVGIEKAQTRSPGETIQTDWATPGMDYRRRWDLGRGTLTLHSPYASATARDPGESGERTEESEARTGAEAKRWARGTLLGENRLRETLEITGDFTPRWTAMGRIDTEGPGVLGGKWTIDEVEHDLVREKSRCVLLRSTEGIE